MSFCSMSDTRVFGNELDELERSATGCLRVMPVRSDAPAWPGEKGRLDRERMARRIPATRERDAVLCGPPPMMKSVRAVLAGLGVPRASTMNVLRFDALRPEGSLNAGTRGQPD